MPFVTPTVFRQVATALRQHAIVRPAFQQQPGHPVGFSAILRKQLGQLRGDNGARELLKGQPVFLLSLETSEVVQDIDLPSQLPASE
ncbi:MobA-like NTP transferase domain protein [compost metagenome]